MQFSVGKNNYKNKNKDFNRKLFNKELFNILKKMFIPF